MRSAKKAIKPSKAESASTAIRQMKQTQIRKAGTKAIKSAAKATTEKADGAAKRKAGAARAAKRTAERKNAAQSAALASVGARKSARVRKAPAAVKAPAAAKASRTKGSTVIKASPVIKASTVKAAAPVKASKAPQRRKVSDSGATTARSKTASAGRVQPTSKNSSAKARTGKSVVQAKGARPAAAAKKTRSGAIKREAASSSIGGRVKTAPPQSVAASVPPAAKKRPADSLPVRPVRVSAPEVIDLIEASKRQPIGRAAAPGRAAASVNSIPSEDEQKIVARKIEKKTSVESPAIVRRPADAAVAAAIVTARAAAVREAAPAPVVAEPTQVEAKSGDKGAVAIAKPVKPSNASRQGFRPSDFIVYPAHGVGQIVAIEEQEVAGFKLELYVIIFVKDKMILKVPTPKVASVGMRKLADADVVRRALDTLTGRARVKRTMWSRRAQEYEAKINSGDLISIAEVVRDLYRSDAQPEQSYSERQLYEAALDRMAREVVIVQKLTETETLKAIEAQLQKGPRRGKVEEIDADDAEAEIEEAA